MNNVIAKCGIPRSGFLAPTHPQALPLWMVAGGEIVEEI